MAVLSVLLLGGCQEESHDPQSGTESAVSQDQPSESAAAARAGDGWELVWSDEFDTFDDSKWTKIDAPSGINNDLAYLSPANVWIQGGMLRIQANNNPTGGRNFTGGKVISKDKGTFKYGRFEVRARTASTVGTHTAAWLLNAPCDGINPCSSWPPEIDIVEMIGREPNNVHQTVHYSTSYRGRWPNWEFDVTTTPFSGDQVPGQAFHEYAVEWEEDEIRWYIDDELIKTWNPNNENSFISDEPMYLILDVVVGGDWAQSPNNTSVWPQYADFDYVRVYKKTDTGPDGPGEPTGDGTYRIKNAASGRYLTADGTDEEWITPFQTGLNNDWATQRWEKTDTGDGWFTLSPQWPQNRTLTANGSGGNQPVSQAAYQGWNTQLWKAVETTGGRVRLVPQWPTNVVLTTSDDSDWSLIRQNELTNTNQEQWFLERVE